MEQQTKREFTGVWIPKHILEDEGLKPVDRLIYAEISCFDVCTMTNATLAERAGCSEDTASRSVGRLKEHGYIQIIGFNGRVRKMQSFHIMPPQNAEPASAKCRGRVRKMPKQPPQNKAQDNNIDNNIENIQNTTITNVIEDKPQQYGNPYINEMFEYWQNTVGYEIVSRKQANRNACKNLLAKYKTAGVKQLIDATAIAQSDRYAPRISDFSSMQSKLNDLIAWGKKKGKTNAAARF